MPQAILGGKVIVNILVLHLLLHVVKILAVGLRDTQTLRNQLDLVLLEGVKLVGNGLASGHSLCGQNAKIGLGPGCILCARCPTAHSILAR